MRLSPALVRACAILDAVAQSGEGVGVSALARDLAIPRNTAYELVNTLVACSLVSFDSGGRVRLGFHLFELGSAYVQSLDLFNEARPIVRELVRATADTVHVAMLDGRHVVFLVKEEGEQSVRNLSAVGRRIPAHGTAVGKAMLAFQPREETLQRLNGARLERLTPATITDVDALLAELDATVERGYSTDVEESNPGVCCLAAPVRNALGVVIAGMSLATRRSRMTTGREEELSRLIVRAAEQLSRRLGYLPRRSDTADLWSSESAPVESGTTPALAG